MPFVPNKVQLTLINNLTGFDLVLKARQVGISTVIQAWHFYQQMRGDVRTSTLCHEDELTTTIRQMVDRFYNNLPEKERPARKYANAKLNTYPTKNSEGSIATVGGSAGSKKGRGGSVTHIHGSEVAFWPDAQGVLAAALQAGNPEIILESTPNGAIGWFFDRCMEALDQDGIWTLHFFPWWYEDEYRIPLDAGEVINYTAEEQVLVEKHDLTPEQIKWRRAKKKQLKELFPQEYPEDPVDCFIQSGFSYFGDLSKAFKVNEEAEPEPDHQYFGGLDFGQSNDYTVLSVIDKTAKRQVALLRINHLPWGEMRRQIRVMAQKWQLVAISAEKNSMGSTNIEELKKEFRQHGMTTKIVPFETTNESKADAAGDLHEALHDGGLLLLDRSDSKREFRAFKGTRTTTGMWRLAADSDEHDDIVISTMLSWFAALRLKRSFIA